MKNNIRVNDIPLNERPIEKLLQFGVNTLSHDELLAIVLRTGTKGEKCIRQNDCQSAPQTKKRTNQTVWQLEYASRKHEIH